jgi:hypothetical protein
MGDNINVANVIDAKKVERSSDAIMQILADGCQKYLTTTWFGLTSIYYHGSAGKNRAEKITKLLQNPKVAEKEHTPFLLLKALLLSSSSSLNNIVSEMFIDHPMFSQEYKNKVKDYATRSISTTRTAIIISILEMNICPDVSTDSETLVDVSSPAFIKHLITHLDDDTEINIKYLIP